MGSRYKRDLKQRELEMVLASAGEHRSARDHTALAEEADMDLALS
jgi:hypothetical protein